MTKSGINPTGKIYIAGHRGLVGSAVLKTLKSRGYENIITRTHAELDLKNQAAVNDFFKTEKPDYVFVCAAKVGGIYANNTQKVEFLYENLMIECNTIHAAANSGVEKLLFLGSSCIYPKMAPQPLKEEYLLTGALETTNEPYALAKIAGLKLCEYYNRQYSRRFISAMPTNMYGPNDNYHPEYSHVLPALIRRFHEAKMRNLPEVKVWGTGTPKREFLFSDDLGDALVLLMEKYEDASTINVGTGVDQTIAEVAATVAQTVGYGGKLAFDPSKPDGTPRKILDVSKISALGWKPKTSLSDGLRIAYESALKNKVLD